MNRSDRLKVIIADDHPIFRQGLVQIIAAEPLFEIVGESGNGAEALELIKLLKPDLAVLDISMPGMNGLDVVKEAEKESLPVHFIILTMFTEEEYFNEAMDCGVKGYLLKENATSDLLQCLKAVAQGEYYISPSLSGYLINRNRHKNALHEKVPTLADLTEMEKRILKLIAENKTSKEIASELFISYRTVQNHRNNICQKLGLKGHHKLLQFALENKGLI